MLYICNMKTQQNADLKSSLIDLEADNTATGGKQQKCGQSERLSERTNYCVYWIKLPEHNNVYVEGYVGITNNFITRMVSHKSNKKKNYLRNAISKYNWETLLKEKLHENITLEQALKLELQYRPTENLGWNHQMGGNVGVDSSWYDIKENRIKHSINTSIKTKEAIKIKDTKEARSKRGKDNWKNNPESYKNSSRGSKNSKAILNEEQVKIIKCKLIPSGIKSVKIAEMFNVEPHVIYFIKSGKNWKHVRCDSPAYE